MTDIHGYGTAIPCYRLKAEEIHRAWNRAGGRGEKAVPAPDEDVVTLCVKAARRALAHAEIVGAVREPSLLGAIYACSVSTGYGEHTLAGNVALAIGAEGPVTLCDLGLSIRSVTSAIGACSDAITAGRIEYGLVVAGDILRARPGSDGELSSGAGAGAVILGRREGVARIDGIASHSDGFIGRYRPEGGFAQMDDERFVFQKGFAEQTARAAKRLMERLEIAPGEFAHIIIGAPEPRWAGRAVSQLGIASEKLFSVGSQIGSAGCAGVLIDLAGVLEERAQPGEKILAISWGPGGSDALALTVQKIVKAVPTVTEQLAQQEYISYTTYLRYLGLVEG
jgi:hydroxymethylglutaryl-CoA synthase